MEDAVSYTHLDVYKRQLVKDARDSLSPCGVYCVPCLCGQVYIGTTKHSVQTHMGVHIHCCHLHQPEKSTVAEHALYNSDHQVLFEETKVLSSIHSCYPHLHRESELGEFEYTDTGRSSFRQLFTLFSYFVHVYVNTVFIEIHSKTLQDLSLIHI